MKHLLAGGQCLTDRRTFLKAGAVATTLIALPSPALARIVTTSPAARKDKSLSFHNTHTGETLNKVVFWSEGAYVPEGLAAANRVLRDHRSGDVTQMDPSLLDILHDLCLELDSSNPVHIISGYRSPATNAALAKRSSGVARNSLHTKGKAIDIRLPGRDLAQLRRCAMSLKAGGVGYYPASNFVHVDTGRPRYW